MIRLNRLLLLCLALLCLLLPCAASAQTACDAARTEYGIGSCHSLSQDAAIIILFAGDDVSSWDDASVSEVYQRVEAAAQLLRDTAASYGYELTLPVYYYTDNERREIRYTGVISTGGAQLDALSGIAENWGFADKQAMHEALQEYTGMDQLAYIVAHNKSGYAYAQSQSFMSSYTAWCDPEYCVLAVRSEYGEIFPAASYAHELLHLFGAQDLYRKDINSVIYNEQRAALCQKLCPGELMLNSWIDLSKADISGFTAYCVGWIDFLPGNYNVRGWWKDTQWESWYLP